MDRFIRTEDYTVVLRDSIKNTMLGEYSEQKIFLAEDKAISQIESYLSGIYDTKDIFSKRGEERNQYMVMIVIDCALYHLYSGYQNKVSETRDKRYGDALEWLRAVRDGTIKPNFPLKKDSQGNDSFNFKIKSRYEKQEYKF